jgi:hypothetical protein
MPRAALHHRGIDAGAGAGTDRAVPQAVYRDTPQAAPFERGAEVALQDVAHPQRLAVRLAEHEIVNAIIRPEDLLRALLLGRHLAQDRDCRIRDRDRAASGFALRSLPNLVIAHPEERLRT